MRATAFMFSIYAAVPFILWRPYIGILMYLWVSYMSPQRLVWGVSRQFQIAVILAGATIIGWLISREPKRIPLTPVTVIVLMLTGWTTVTTIFALVPDVAYTDGWTELVKLTMMSLITVSLVNSRKRLELLLWVTAGSVAFYGVKGGIFAALTGGTARVFGPSFSQLSDNNALALGLLMILPLLRYLQMEARTWWMRWGLAGAMGLCGLSVIASYSRGAFLAAIAMMTALIVKSRKRALLGAALAAALVVGLSMAPDKWYERISTIENYQQDESAQGRFDAWRFAFLLALDRPLLGGGFWVSTNPNIFNHYVPGVRSRSFHSIYFEMLGEHGFVGLALFLALWIAAFRSCTRVNRLTRNRNDLIWAGNLARMIQVSLIAFAVGGTFLNKAFFELYYGILMITVVTEVLVQKARKAATAEKQKRPGEGQAMPVPSSPPNPGMRVY